MEQIIHTNGFNLHIVPSKKYKTMTIVAKMRGQLKRSNITKRALLPHILRQGSKAYPTRAILQNKLDDLYGASLSIDGGKAGNHHVISVRMEVANQKYIENESSIIQESIELLNEVLFNPLVTENSFDESIVNREKQTLKQQLHSIKDDKVNYAQLRLIDEMCAGETFQIHSQGYEEDLEDITAANLYETYQTFINEDVLDIYVLGDFDHHEVTKIFEATINKQNKQVTQSEALESENVAKEPREKPQEIIEKQDIQQAKLHIGYRTQTVYKDTDFPALLIFNGILGAFPSSKLFINVREKNGLAYYVASNFDNYTGLLYVYSGVAAKDYEKARQIIEQQFKAMQLGDFTDMEIEETKGMIVSQILESMDNGQGLIELLYQNTLGGRDEPLTEFIEQINKVTKDEVIKMAQKVKEDTVFLLTSEEA